MIRFIFVLDNNGNIVYGWTPEEVEAYIEKKTANGKSLFAPQTVSNAPQELSDAESSIRAHAKKNSVLWVLGNSEMLRRTLDVADQLYITQIDRFDSAEEEFVPFGDKFYMAKKGKIHRSKHGVIYQHQIWNANRLATNAQEIRDSDTRES